MIELVNVNKYFNRHKKNELHVIDSTSIKLEEKGLVAFLGASGSGKTTLLNIIGGLDKFNKGSLYIDGKKITKYNYHKMDKIRNLSVGYIFQDYKLIDNMTVYDNIALVLKMIGLKNKAEIRKRVYYVLEATGIYRYRNRLASMLSGGERQRVGIARALVKNPDIILADEPTGNLDSKNSIEVMNIIKSISKNKLVILVTHEVELADFYADRIVSILDGKVVSDEVNKNSNDLDYRMDNKIYLKDFKCHENIKNNKMNINIYSSKDEKVDINIIFKNDNIYIESKNKRLEVIDEDSNIELINDHYKKINKDMINSSKFDLDSISGDYKKKNSSIFNIFTLLIAGFKKVFNYSILKKILLLGFFITGIFITYSVSSIFATLKVNEEDYVTKNRNYLSVAITKISVDDYLKYSKLDSINYMLPSDSDISLKVYYKEYYQSTNYEDSISGSLASTSMISESDIIYGKMPTRSHEIAIDKMVAKKLIKEGYAYYVGLNTVDELVGLKVYTRLDEEFTIVGITDLVSPSIYAREDMLIDLIDTKTNIRYGYLVDAGEDANIVNYKVFLKYGLVKGRMPENDYEVLVNINKEYTMPLNKEINVLVNDRNLVVVGYYDSYYNVDYYLVNENTIKYKLISNTSNLVIYPKDEAEVLNYFRDNKMNISNTYELDKEKYTNERSETVRDAIIVSGVIILISLVEIFLMIRSSFLSRIKEIGILRAIGVKKTDILKMFIGEIIAISTLAGLTGILFMTYILKMLTKIDMLASAFVVDMKVVLISTIVMYMFNIIVGLLPVINVLRHTPASILARHDID